jgi:hypothetical protein
VGRRAFNHKTGECVAPCPTCGNHRSFVARSDQVAEDLCEVWIICVCGFDPTAEATENRMEDVWGSLDPQTIWCALENCWNEPLTEKAEVPS